MDVVHIAGDAGVHPIHVPLIVEIVLSVATAPELKGAGPCRR